MSGPAPAVAAARVAVTKATAGIRGTAEADVLVACSGGADSLALAAATAFVARRAPWRAGAVIVDHGLQPGSAQVAATAAAACRDLGLGPVRVVRVEVDPTGVGLEAGARRARYAAMEQVAAGAGAQAVLLGHTLDDQAESVLLALARGSGARSLAGMAPRRGLWRRPFLGLRRADTEAVCATLGLEFWQDPTNGGLCGGAAGDRGPGAEFSTAKVPTANVGTEVSTVPAVPAASAARSVESSASTRCTRGLSATFGDRGAAGDRGPAAGVGTGVPAAGESGAPSEHPMTLPLRSQVRTHVMPVLHAVLGQRASIALARSADLLRDDADLLDQLAAELLAAATATGATGAGTRTASAVGRQGGAALARQAAAGGKAGWESAAATGDPALIDDPAASSDPAARRDLAQGLDLEVLGGAHPALRRRALKAAATNAGCPPGALAAVHIQAMDELVTAWRGQGPVFLPGGFEAVRQCGRLCIHPPQLME